jgi:hypothetical protein
MERIQALGADFPAPKKTALFSGTAKTAYRPASP